MPAVKHYSQIDMLVPPTEDGHLVRLEDAGLMIQSKLDEMASVGLTPDYDNAVVFPTALPSTNSPMYVAPGDGFMSVWTNPMAVIGPVLEINRSSNSLEQMAYQNIRTYP